MDVSSFLRLLKDGAAPVSNSSDVPTLENGRELHQEVSFPVEENGVMSSSEESEDEDTEDLDLLGERLASRTRRQRHGYQKASGAGEDFAPLNVLKTNTGPAPLSSTGSIVHAARRAATLAAARARLSNSTGGVKRYRNVDAESWRQHFLAQKRALPQLETPMAVPASKLAGSKMTGEEDDTGISLGALLAAEEIDPGKPLELPSEKEQRSDEINIFSSVPVGEALADDENKASRTSLSDSAITSPPLVSPAPRVTSESTTPPEPQLKKRSLFSIAKSIASRGRETPQTQQQFSKYIVGKNIGEGQFGSIRVASVKETGASVVLKIIRVVRLNEGIPHPIAREGVIAPQLDHPHVVRTLEVFTEGTSLVLVMEKCHTNLAETLVAHSVRRPLPRHLAKKWMIMLLSAVQYMHSKGVLHRDIKPANCLLSHDGDLKLGDFGLSRVLDRMNEMTHEVQSRWYRAPELLLGQRHYAEEIDMWSVGCVMAELVRGHGGAIFRGDGDIRQLSHIFSVLGTPDQDVIPFMPDWGKIHFEEKVGVGIESIMPGADPLAVDVVKSMLCLHPKKRLLPHQVLSHPYFIM